MQKSTIDVLGPQWVVSPIGGSSSSLRCSLPYISGTSNQRIFGFEADGLTLHTRPLQPGLE